MTEIEKFTKSGTPVVRCTYNIILADKKLYQSERIDYRDETTTIFASLRGRKKNYTVSKYITSPRVVINILWILFLTMWYISHSEQAVDIELGCQENEVVTSRHGPSCSTVDLETVSSTPREVSLLLRSKFMNESRTDSRISRHLTCSRWRLNVTDAQHIHIIQ
jgi:hypothetical protein